MGRPGRVHCLAFADKEKATTGRQHLIVETAESHPGRPRICRCNVDKSGFQITYLRSDSLYCSWE